ncbi:MAG TPA: hypothetical protein VHB21_26335, partial [Minicystis sp.]|nr:hypothetical protein [Minicystis sp.]
GARDAGADERRVQALFTECRFGFVSALRAWKDNAAARDGLAACLALAVEHEIARRDLERARAALDELPEPNDELAARVDGLARALAAEAAEQARARSLADDHDLRVGGPMQLAVLTVFPAFALGVAIWIFSRHRAPSTAEVVGAPAIATALVGAAALTVRRRLGTAISRRALTVFVLVPAVATVHRVAGYALGDALPSLFAGDLLLAAVALGVLGITLVRPAAWAVVPLAAGALAIVAHPASALATFAASTGCTFALLFLVWRRAVR